jgi:chromosome segregation ATPase
MLIRITFSFFFLVVQKQARNNAKATTELKAQLNAVQEDMKTIESDKAQILEDLALAKRLTDEAYGKLEESLAAQRSAEEALELERFKSTEREQSGIERKEQEWRRKCDNMKRHHAEDVASLIAATRELEGVKDELAVTVQAKDAALEQVQRIANDNAKKVEALMAEVSQLKSHHGAQLQAKAKEATQSISKLESEASALRAELQKAKAFQEKLAKADQQVEGFKVDIAYLRRAEADANQSAQEWKKKAESFQTRLQEVSRPNKANEELLTSFKKSFEDCTSMLQDKQSQVIQLKEKVASLEKEANEYREGFLGTNRRLDVAKEAFELQATIDRLTSEHQMLHEAHRQVATSEKTVSAQVGHLTEEKNKLLKELDDTRQERDRVKKAVQDLAAALREVSSEAREAKERVLAKQLELENAQLQISELKAAMKSAEDKYQSMLDESKNEADCLRKTVEKMCSEAKTSEDEWICKEAGFVDMLKKSDDGISSIQSEMNRLAESLRAAENEVQVLKGDKTQLLSKLQEFELKTKNTSSSAEKAKAEMRRLTESLRAAENEMQVLKGDKTQLLSKLQEFELKTKNTSSSAEETKAENSQLEDLVSSKEKEALAMNHQVTDLRYREHTALEKANELSKLLTEATARKSEEEEAAKNTDVSVMKLEMDEVQESLKAAECEVKAAKDDKAQLQNKLRLLESKMTEASLTSEEAKLNSLRLKEMLEDKEHEVASIAQENNDLRAREADAQAKIYELAALLAEATAKKGGESNGMVARSPEKQPSVLRKFMCSPMHNVHDDEPCESSARTIQMEEIKHVEMEIVKQIKCEKESISTVDANSLENSKIIEDDLSKERDDDSESTDDDIESPDDALADQMNGLLITGPTSSFNQQPQHMHNKKKKALLKKFGGLLKKKAHFTKLSSHP